MNQRVDERTLYRRDLEPRRLGAALGAGSVGALAFGALALGAFAVGAVAIGRLAIRRAGVKTLRACSLLEVGDLVVGSLTILESPTASSGRQDGVKPCGRTLTAQGRGDPPEAPSICRPIRTRARRPPTTSSRRSPIPRTSDACAVNSNTSTTPPSPRTAKC